MLEEFLWVVPSYLFVLLVLIVAACILALIVRAVQRGDSNSDIELGELEC